MKKGTLPLIALLFAVIILGGAAYLSASPDRSKPRELYDHEEAMRASVSLYKNKNDLSWIENLDRIIPPEERQRLAEADPSELNMTERFAQSLSVVVLGDLNQADNTGEVFSGIDPDDYGSFVANFIEQEITSLVPAGGFFEKESLNVQKDHTKEDITNYGNAVGEIITRNSPSLDHEINIFANLIEKGGNQGELDLREIARGYKKIADEASVLQVPESASDLHLAFINNMKRTGLYVEKMSLITEDPLLAILCLNKYVEKMDESVEIMRSVAKYFEDQGVSYQSDEEGSAYTFMSYVDWLK